MNQDDQKNISPESRTEESVSPVEPTEPSIPSPVKAAGIHLVLRPVHLIIAAVCALAIVAGGVLLGIQIHNWTVDPDIDRDAEKYPYPVVTDTAEDQIAVPGYSTVQFPANTRRASIVLPNPENNPCYFVFSIILTDSGETVYRSGMIPPGMAVTEITLQRPLESGTYPIEIRIETFSLTDKSPMNGANVKATLVVT